MKRGLGGVGLAFALVLVLGAVAGACAAFDAEEGVAPGSDAGDAGSSETSAPPELDAGSDAAEADGGPRCVPAGPTAGCFATGGCSAQTISLGGVPRSLHLARSGAIFATREVPIDGGTAGALLVIPPNATAYKSIRGTGREPLGITDGNGRLYWSNRDAANDYFRVSSCDLADPYANQAHVANRGNSARPYYNLAYASGALFVSEDTGTFRTLAPGYPVPPTAAYLGTGTGGDVSMVTDAERVYWIYGNTAAVLSSARHGGDDVTVTPLPPAPLPSSLDGGTYTRLVRISALASDCARVYLGVSHLVNGVAVGSSVYSVDKASGSFEIPALLELPNVITTSLAVDAAYLYVGTTSGLWAYRKSDGTSVQMSASGSPRWIQTDDDVLVWGDETNVIRVDKK